MLLFNRTMNNDCPFCNPQQETILWQDAHCRVLLVADADYPGYCRVIWNTHIKEMTDLAKADRAHFMCVVFSVEAVLREALQPTKINLASLGNQTPHLHWHVIPRYSDDAHFPNSIWSERQRGVSPRAQLDADTLRNKLAALLS